LTLSKISANETEILQPTSPNGDAGAEDIPQFDNSTRTKLAKARCDGGEAVQHTHTDAAKAIAPVTFRMATPQRSKKTALNISSTTS
jgi:hypothetical protein